MESKTKFLRDLYHSSNLRRPCKVNNPTKVLIKMSPEDYDPFVAECAITSAEYSTLKNAVIAHDGEAGDRRTIEILCDEEDAFNLLDAARRLYPDAVPAIAAGIDLKSTVKHGQLVNRRQ
ncbi:MAG TPA: hypothetical protein VGK57_09590 [Candidatus Binatia bacterium]